MNYILFDLEWNQCPHGPEYENPRIPFEIIEIGAVKLNDRFKIIDEYNSIVKPRVYKTLHHHIRQMLNYDETVLKTGRPFEVVCKEFKKWCGDDFIFGTWGTSDITQLQKNMEYYYMQTTEEPLRYYDIQAIFGEAYPDPGPCRLEKAVETLQIPQEECFHTAINDARYTAYVFQKLSKRNLKDQYTYDYYHAPTDEEHEIHSYHRNYAEHISHGFDDKLYLIEDENFGEFLCYKCKRKLNRKIDWFSNNQNQYLGVGKCWYHGYQKGTIKFKLSNKGQTFAVKRIAPIPKSEVETIRNRKLELREKRREKRRNH